MFVQHFHSFNIIIYSVVGVSLVFCQEWIDLKAPFSSTQWQLLVLIANEIEQVDSVDGVVKIGLVARCWSDLVPTSPSGGPYHWLSIFVLPKTVLCHIFQLKVGLVIIIA